VLAHLASMSLNSQRETKTRIRDEGGDLKCAIRMGISKDTYAGALQRSLMMFEGCGGGIRVDNDGDIQRRQARAAEDTATSIEYSYIHSRWYSRGAAQDAKVRGVKVGRLYYVGEFNWSQLEPHRWKPQAPTFH
jgi:hypothetical protein